jgi:ribosomal protein L37AE/L43A
MARIVRKPVPQISSCKQCGHDFKYMRTRRTRWYCEDCLDAKSAVWHKAAYERKKKAP